MWRFKLTCFVLIEVWSRVVIPTEPVGIKWFRMYEDFFAFRV